jgi:hypothetical protein
VEQVCGGRGQMAPLGGGGGKEGGRKINMVQTVYTHACKCKYDTC